MTRRLFFVLSLFVLLGAGCNTAVSEPTSTQSANIAATEVIVTETAVASPTVIPTSTPTPRPTTIPTDLPELIWQQNLEEKTVVASRHTMWSPVANEILFDNCSHSPFSMLEPQVVSFSPAPNFEPVSLDLVDIACPFMTEFTWNPDGQRILFSGVLLPAEDGFFSDVWMLDRESQKYWNLERLGKFLEFLGWMDEGTLVYRDHWGASNWLVHTIDTATNAEVASAYIHGASVYLFTTDFAIGNDVSSEASASAVSLGREVVDSKCQSRGSYLKVLSLGSTQPCYDYLFNSHALDLLMGTNQVLVRTWGTNEYLTDTIRTQTDLQLWDAETDELTMLVPGGISGQFSPDGRFLAYQLFGEEFPPIHLLDQNTGEVILTEPSGYSSESFSPNGRFLTFYSPTPELMIYDLEKGEFLPSVTAVPFTPLWSPDNGRFVYNDPENGLSIYEAATQSTYPLAASGGERLSNPQWSFDGAYLSVVVLQEDGEGETAVLQLSKTIDNE